MHLKFKVKEEYFLILFFAMALFFNLNLSKLPLSYPGNIKAADPFYHTISVESILETKQWNYYNYYLSLGTEKVINHQPPLIYTASAMLSEFSGLPAWVTLYFLICISQALFIVAVYLIALEAFGSKKIGLIAAGLCIMPMPVRFWLYGVYIGFWLQVPSYFLIMALVWLTIKYIKNQKDYLLLTMGFSIAAIFLLHIADLMIVFFEMLYVGIILLVDFFRKKDIASFVKKALLIGLFPLIALITVLPRILYVWSGLGTSMFTPGFYGFFRDAFPKEQYGGMVWPHFSFFPMAVIILFIIGMSILLFISLFYILSIFNKKIGMPGVRIEKGRLVFSIKKNENHFSYFIIFLVVAFYFASVYLSPAFFSDPYYLGGRARSLQPFFVFPVIAFVLWLGITMIEMFAMSDKNNSTLFQIFLVLAIVASSIIFSLGEYNQLADGLKGEHITETKWNAYKWIHENTKKDAKVLFFDGVFQGENVYVKRISAVMSLDNLNKFLMEYQETNKTPEVVTTAGWGGNTIREGGWKYEKSFFSYGDYYELNSTQRIDYFDYIIFENFAQEAVQINAYFASELVKKGWKPVYNDGFSIIIQK